ncbi:MAG: hypothetical protein R2745_22140 [Vicinamibacterales bacterium]
MGDDARVRVVTERTPPDCYRITATAEFDSPPEVSWRLLRDWERFVEVAFPGMTSNFRWLRGTPDEVPSQFQFEIAGIVLKEEIYERTHGDGDYVLRYRALEPALGVLEYDAVLRLLTRPDGRTAFEAVRDVRLESGTPPDMLAEMVRSETQCLVDHFAA